jgi:hypothetical protein
MHVQLFDDQIKAIYINDEIGLGIHTKRLPLRTIPIP